jgi:DNA-binding transcriptional ArsR family regulator
MSGTAPGESHHPKDVEYPPDRNHHPRDAGETFDLVVRKGPISLDGLMDQIYSYSQSEVAAHLAALLDDDYIRRREGDIDRDGTTRDLYFVHEKRVRSRGDGA